MFGKNDEVVFGDVNLSKNQVRKGSPGAGGWPTVRYFNKKTGLEGEAYKQKTSEAMCTELGPGKPYLQQFIEEAGETSLCSVKTEAGCTDKEKTFIQTWKKKLADGTPAADVEKQITRLSGMTGSSMKEELLQWVRQRLAIFKQLKQEL
jgi:hypothetical protein